MNSLYRTLGIVTVACAAGLAGCAAAPGMHMEKPQLNRVVEASPSAPVEPLLLPITPELIASEMRSAVAGETFPEGLRGGRRGDYVIGKGDVLTITVWDHPELTIPAGEFRSADIAGHLVNEDGAIFYPYVGTIEVAGKTVSELRALLSKRLKTYIQNPQLDVRVAAFRSKKAFVTGEVKQPSVLPVTDRPLTVLEAINLAGGTTENADLRNVRLTRNGEVYSLDVLALYREGAYADLYVSDRDQLHVPDRYDNRVYVMGEVGKPSFFLMENGRMNLADALSAASGVNQEEADASEIYVIRGAKERPIVYRLDAESADAMILATAFQLAPYDVVYVAPTGLTRWNRVMSQVLPSVQTLWQTKSLIDRW